LEISQHENRLEEKTKVAFALKDCHLPVHVVESDQSAFQLNGAIWNDECCVLMMKQESWNYSMVVAMRREIGA